MKEMPCLNPQQSFTIRINMKYVITFMCVYMSFLCFGCNVSKCTTGNIEGTYYFFWGGDDGVTSLPSITLYSDSTFEYIVPGLGGPYRSTGEWSNTKKGIRLSTRFTCIGAIIEPTGMCEKEDSIDVFFSFLEGKGTLNEITINKCKVALDSANHLRTTANVLNECTCLYVDDFEFFPKCSHCDISNGNKYTIILVDNPYYPIIDNEEWISKDGMLYRPRRDDSCMFRKKQNTGLK